MISGSRHVILQGRGDFHFFCSKFREELEMWILL